MYVCMCIFIHIHVRISTEADPLLQILALCNNNNDNNNSVRMGEREGGLDPKNYLSEPPKVRKVISWGLSSLNPLT